MGKSKLKLVKANSEKVESSEKYKSLISLNVMAEKYAPINDPTRIPKQFEYLQKENPDIVFLQEVDTDYFAQLESKGLNYFLYKTDLEPYGQIILTKWKMNYQVYQFGKSHKKVLVVYDDQYQFINVHLTARASEVKQRSSQINKILKSIVDPNKKVILGGDTNMVSENETIENWYDVAQTNREPTFDSENNIFAAPVKDRFRPDRIYTNMKSSIFYKVQRIVFSDHFPIYIEIESNVSK